MNSYSADELKLAIGQECTLVYFKDEITGIIFNIIVDFRGLERLILKTSDQNIKEAFFISRIRSVPFIDEMRKKRLCQLLK